MTIHNWYLKIETNWSSKCSAPKLIDIGSQFFPNGESIFLFYNTGLPFGLLKIQISRIRPFRKCWLEIKWFGHLAIFYIYIFIFWKNLSKTCNILWNFNFESSNFHQIVQKIWPLFVFFFFSETAPCQIWPF